MSKNELVLRERDLGLKAMSYKHVKIMINNQIEITHYKSDKRKLHIDLRYNHIGHKKIIEVIQSTEETGLPSPITRSGRACS